MRDCISGRAIQQKACVSMVLDLNETGFSKAEVCCSIPVAVCAYGG